jgi:hypothetical protein
MSLDPAVEGSTYILSFGCSNEAGTPIIPVTAAWSLHDNSGDVVNGRSEISLSVLSTIMSVVLSGADLAYDPNSSNARVFTVKGTYNSSYGSGLPIAEEFSFAIRPLTGIPDK